MTASTRADAWGVYAYSGQTLPTILSDIQAQWFDPLHTAGILPDLVVGHALIENDIVADATVAAMKASLTSWLRNVRNRWPGATVLLSAPRPSFSYNTAGRVSAYQAMRDYILGLDDGVGVLCVPMDGYEDPANPAQPLASYTDSSVHPNARGALVNARGTAVALGRMAQQWTEPYQCLSTNMAVTGSAAASGTNVTGTKPTSCTIGGSSDGTFVGAAEDPGFSLSVTVASKPAEPTYDLGTFNFGSQSLSDVTQISPFVVVEIVSGAANLKSIELAPRLADDSGAPFSYYMQDQTGDANPDWIDGDVLTLRQPPILATSGSLTGQTNYVRTRMGLGGGTTAIRVLSQGVGLVN